MFSILAAKIKFFKQKGLRFCAFRTWYEFQKKTGLLKRKYPVMKWQDIKVVNLIDESYQQEFEISLKNAYKFSGRFFFDNINISFPNYIKADKLINHGNLILRDKFCYFFNDFKELGNPPNWFINPFTLAKGDSTNHWCDIQHFDAKVGDIKFIWEPSRFAWAYTLARAYAFTKDERYSEKFWQLFQSWMDINQPNIGHNFVCGQECAIRLMAICFALFVFRDSGHTTDERLSIAIKAIYIHADRIERNIAYAVSTKTNHSITEAAGIYTVGLLFPFFRRSGHWKKKGKEVLAKEGLKQIYDDGSYIQNSMSYHRLMLQDYIWVLRLADINKDQFPETLTQRINKAVNFIYQLQDDNSGRVPNYGANDSSLIIPLNNCNYLDYRPVIQSGYYLFNNKKLYEHGPWDEDLLWFFGEDAVKDKIEQLPKIDLQADSGGYYSIRNNDSFAMMRCHTFKDRPGHADMLHLDLWYKGKNIFRDSGSYMYNCPEKWQNYFMGTSSHNTVVVDGCDQMQKGNLWNWFDWTSADFLGFSKEDDFAKMTGRHYGYTRLKGKIVHERTIYVSCDYWIIVDTITGYGTHTAQLNWQLCDGKILIKNNRCVLDCAAGKMSIATLSTPDINYVSYCGDEEKPAGFESIYYGQMKPGNVITVSIKKTLPIKFITLVGLNSQIKNLKYNSFENTLSWDGYKITFK